MNQAISPVETGAQVGSSDLRGLFHQLSNQLGIILANAELMELKADSPLQRDRAAQMVHAVVEAIAVARSMRDRAGH